MSDPHLRRTTAFRAMVRRVANDYEALVMCQAFEEAGGEAFSVVFVPEQKTAATAFIHERGSTMGWHVFGRADEPDAVDDAFQRLVDK